MIWFFILFLECSYLDKNCSHKIQWEKKFAGCRKTLQKSAEIADICCWHANIVRNFLQAYTGCKKRSVHSSDEYQLLCLADIFAVLCNFFYTHAISFRSMKCCTKKGKTILLAWFTRLWNLLQYKRVFYRNLKEAVCSVKFDLQSWVCCLIFWNSLLTF